MIGFIAGTLLENQDGKALVAIAYGDGGKLGYTLLTPTSPAYAGLHPGQGIELHVHTHVREDALDLIGFLTKVEKEIFLTLLNVNGIGPKGALGILSKLEIATLVEAVLSESTALLTDVPGIGKKTAERLVMELKDPLRKKVESGLLSAPSSASAGVPSTKTTVGVSEKIALSLQVLKEAREALGSLGYREVEITAALKRVSDQLKDGARDTKRSEEIIKLALKELA